ncbi:MAG: hypothetical protein L0Y80_04365 [Ignavibacteriae bacterium]|nr:hypothetical protein [Ignavibacteriota bacterium]
MLKHCFHIVLGLMIATQAYAFQTDMPDKSRRAEPRSLHKTTGTPRYAVLNINNLRTWHRSDGQSNHSPSSDNGLYYPRFTAWTIYQDGLMYGGKAYVDPGFTQGAPYSQIIRVGGATYGTGTQAGHVTGLGAAAVAINPSDPNARIYRIRRDYFTLKGPITGAYTEELRRDAAEVYEKSVPEISDADMEAVVAQYATDWDEWPVQFGAPFIDRNGNGIYDPPPAFTIGNPDDDTDNFTVDSLIKGQYDEPGVAGTDDSAPADQVI